MALVLKQIFEVVGIFTALFLTTYGLDFFIRKVFDHE